MRSAFVCIAIVTLAASSAWSQGNPVGDLAPDVARGQERPADASRGEQQPGGGNTQQPAQPGGQALRPGSPSDDTRGFVARVLGSTEAQWKAIFAEGGKIYRPTILVMYNGRTPAGCGAVQAIGPFYCPLDQRVYLDISFCRGKACQAYVIGHEVGHHVQNLLGVLPKVQQEQQRLDKVEANSSACRVASRLPRRRVGQPPEPAAAERGQAALPRATPRRGGDADGLRDRRPTHDRPGDAGPLHPWLFGAAPALVHDRIEGREHLRLQHLQI